MTRNLANSECEVHKKMCEYMCSYSKCAKRLICEKCRREHLDIHPAQFIYELSNLASIHEFPKIDKLKQVLVKQKVAQEATIKQIYKDFDNIASPLVDGIKGFVAESKAMIEKELINYLRSNKFIIDEAEKEIKKSQTSKIKNDANKLLEETINEAEIINRREGRILQNGEGYRWYSDTTKEMCASIVIEVRSMISVVTKMIGNSIKLQRNKYSAESAQSQSHHQLSFFKRYHASNEVAIDRISLQANVLQTKKAIEMKDSQLFKSKKEVRDKVIKISQLQQKIEGLTEQLQAWQQKKEREERQKQLIIEKERKMKEAILIKNGTIGDNGKSLCFERKEIDDKLFTLLLELVPQPVTLDISNHRLTKEQLEKLLGIGTIQKVKYNFTKAQEAMLIKLLRSYTNLSHLQLNSCEINDNMLSNISKLFTPRLKVLYLIDNHITDEGLQKMFSNDNVFLEEFYISYNGKLTFKCIEILHKHSRDLKVLHIAKTQLKQKGGQNIGKYLKNIEELFIGATDMNKEGFLAICKSCTKLKRLSIVANQITTEVVTEILLGLKYLEWLDLSYCKLSASDIEKIEILKQFNKDLIIVVNL